MERIKKLQNWQMPRWFFITWCVSAIVIPVVLGLERNTDLPKISVTITLSIAVAFFIIGVVLNTRSMTKINENLDSIDLSLKSIDKKLNK